MREMAERVSSQGQQKSSLDQTIHCGPHCLPTPQPTPVRWDVSGRVWIGPAQETADVSTARRRPD